MATYTENYSLVKPGYGDQADLDVLNRLMTDKVDALLFENRRISADEYDQTETYAVGDYAIFENVLYKCLEDTTGNFDPSKWEMTNLAKEVSTKGGADVTKTASGNPIEISDAVSAPMVKCVTEIQGSQDLHGYDKPWVGGAGKNKLPLVLADIKSANTSGTWSGSDYTVNGVTMSIMTDNDGNVTGIKANGTPNNQINLIIPASNISDGMILNGCPSGGSQATYYMVSGTIASRSATDTGNGATIDGATDRVIIRIEVNYTPSNLMFYPMIRLASETDPTFEPYSNICPITAYTEGEIEVRGKNLFDGVIEAGAINPATGEDMPQADRYRAKNYIPVYPTNEYIFSKNGTAQPLNISFYGIDKSFVSSTTTANGKISVPANVWYIRFYYNADINVQSGLQLEKGSTPTTYEPYTSTTHTTTYPSAIYRGSEDVVNGEVTSEWPLITFDNNWTLAVGTTSLGLNYADIGYSANNIPLPKNNASGICNSYDWIDSDGTGSNGKFKLLPASLRIYDDRFTTVENAKTYLAGVQFAYELATPTTSSVTPTNLPIKSLNGYTHIESTTGDMEVEYITSEYQPLVDLIQSNKHVYSTEEQIVGTWIDGSTIYEKTIYCNGLSGTSDWTELDSSVAYGKLISANGIRVQTNQCFSFNNGLNAEPRFQTKTDNKVYYFISESLLGDMYITIQYTKATTPTRSLNLTKSAVVEKSDSKEELPDEIKNAEYEEKPETNEADDDAPTEVDER